MINYFLIAGNFAGSATGMIIGQTRLLDNLDLDSESSQCDQLNADMTDLFVFPDEVPFMDIVSVCYYGTNATQLNERVDRLTAILITYQKDESGKYIYIHRARLDQCLSSVHTKKCNCVQIDLRNSTVRNTTLRFGVYNHNRCRKDFCPLKLYSFSNSSMVLHRSIPDVKFKHATNDGLSNQLQIDSATMACWDLNIRIEIPGK